MLRSKADGRVDLVKLYKTLLDIAAGMQYLHSANILHGAVLQGQKGEHGVLMTHWTTAAEALLTRCLLAELQAI